MRKLQLAFLIASCLLVACSPSPQAAAPSSTPPKPTSATPSVTTPTAAVAEQTDWTLPGWITQQTTLAQLQAHYGAGNVRKETLDGPEGSTYSAYVIYPDDPGKRFELEPLEDNGVVTIAGVRIVDMGTRWHDANGLHAGMTLAELVAKNGKPISFSGLDWDYGGTVQDWNGGTLAPPDDLVMYPTIILTRRPGLTESVNVPAGDGLFRSDDPKWTSIGKDLVVGQVLLSWPDESD